MLWPLGGILSTSVLALMYLTPRRLGRRAPPRTLRARQRPQRRTHRDAGCRGQRVLPGLTGSRLAAVTSGFETLAGARSSTTGCAGVMQDAEETSPAWTDGLAAGCGHEWFRDARWRSLLNHRVRRSSDSASVRTAHHPGDPSWSGPGNGMTKTTPRL